MAKKTICIGILGTQLDAARRHRRYDKWRPTFSLFQHDDLQVDGLELLYPASHEALAETIQTDIVKLQSDAKVNLHQVDFSDPWDFEEVFQTLYEFSRGYSFRTDRNDYLIHITTGSHVQQICLFLLTESRHLPGRLIQTGPPRGANKHEIPGTYSVIDLDLSRYDALAARFAAERQEGQEFLKSGIKTQNRSFNQMIERIEKVAIASTAPILLTGPTGAGKTHLARKIFELKRRREQLGGRFVEVNCATLRGDQAMSALFGHVKGAFTGAAAQRDGLLKSADQGLLFLDEIGELGLDEQAMMLRAIEEKTFLPVGSDREVSADFQLITGTNRDLQKRVGEGRFREDLRARINLWTFRMPGLAERIEDIEPNLDYELERMAAETGQHISMAKEARARFLSWAATAPWPGNFRDLGAAVTRMSTLAEGGRIRSDVVREEVERAKSQSRSTATDGSDAVLREFLEPEQIEQLDLFDRAQLATVLTVCQTSDSLAAAGRRLFAVSRESRSSTNDSDRVRKYLGRFDLSWKQIRLKTAD